MVAIVGFLVVIAIVGGLLYMLVIQREVPGVVEQRFGVLEALPPDVGKWKVDADSEEARMALRQGLRREVRVFYDVQKGTLTRQTRYRNQAHTWHLTDAFTGEIYARDGHGLLQPGLFVDLEGWGFHFFRVA